MSLDNTHSHDIVTAVLVAHDGAAWVPHVAHAVASQTRPVQRVVAVDTGSRDRSGAMLAQAFGRGCVFGMDRAAGYGAAVTQALRHRAAHTHVPPLPGGSREERTEWVWLLHDDCEPAPDALERLLGGAAQAPAAAVLGPKVLDWSDRDVLLEAGVTIDRVGRRVTGIEPREVDQGQHDGDRDVVAVSSAGMLIRRDVWDQVGGFDPGMRLFREDADLCWRVHAAGYRVRVITDAVVYHVEASARNRRPTSAAPRRRREDRRNGLLVLLGNLPGRPMLSALVGNLVLSTLRALFFLLAKRPGAAVDELTAYTSVACHPLRLAAARRQRARGRQAAYGRLRNELPPGRSLRKLAEFATGALSKTLPVDTVGSHHATEDPSDDDSLLVDTGLVQRLLTSPGVLLFLALTAIALTAERSLLSSTPLGGGALLPAWGGVSGLWQEYLQGFHPAGIGTAASTPPYVAVIAVLATVLVGKPWLAVDVLLLGCVPLAGVTAFLATRRVTRYVPVRIWAAATYALLPVGMGAVATGRLGTAVVLVLLPLAVMLAGRIFTQPARRARRAAWATALATAVAAAFVPLVWLVMVVAMAAGVLAFGRGRRGSLLNALIVAAVPVALLLPWSVDLIIHPARLFLEAGVAASGLASPRLPARSLLLLSPGGPGLPPFWVTGGLAVAAAIALVGSRRRALVLAGWGVALVGMLIAAGVSRVSVIPQGAAAPVHAWPGAAIAIAGAGLLLAAVAAGERIPIWVRAGRWRSVRGLAVVAVATVACSAPVLAAVAWVAAGVRGPLAPTAGPVLPEFVSVSSATGLRLRTLVLRAGPHGSVSYAVLRSSDPLIGSGELSMPAAGMGALNLSVAALTTPYGGDVQNQGRALAGFGIGYVMLPAPVNPGLARILDGVPGLRPVSGTPAFELWQVAGVAARVTVTEPGGTVVPVPSGPMEVSGAKAPAAGGTLVLAEPAGGWAATLNGRPLAPVAVGPGGWAQGFRLPPGGGLLSISRDQTGRYIAVAAEGLAVLVVAGLGLPGARLAGEAEEAAAPGDRRSAGHGTSRLRGAMPGFRAVGRRAGGAEPAGGYPPERGGSPARPARAPRAHARPPAERPPPGRLAPGRPAAAAAGRNGDPAGGRYRGPASTAPGPHGYPDGEEGALRRGPAGGPGQPPPGRGPGDPSRPQPRRAPEEPGRSLPRRGRGIPSRLARRRAPDDAGWTMPRPGTADPAQSAPGRSPGDPGRPAPRRARGDRGRSRPADYPSRPAYGPAPARGRLDPDPGAGGADYGSGRLSGYPPPRRRDGRPSWRPDESSYGLAPGGRQPSEEEGHVLPPLPPQPPRKHRYAGEFPPGSTGARDGQPYEDPGESDW